MWQHLFFVFIMTLQNLCFIEFELNWFTRNTVLSKYRTLKLHHKQGFKSAMIQVRFKWTVLCFLNFGLLCILCSRVKKFAKFLNSCQMMQYLCVFRSEHAWIYRNAWAEIHSSVGTQVSVHWVWKAAESVWFSKFYYFHSLAHQGVTIWTVSEHYVVLCTTEQGILINLQHDYRSLKGQGLSSGCSL